MMEIISSRQMASAVTAQLNPPGFVHFLHPTLKEIIASCIVLCEGHCPKLWFFWLHSETPVVERLPWVSLKPKLNEIWMCREWIGVMEQAKYCLRSVCALLSLGDRFSDRSKVKLNSKFSGFISRPKNFLTLSW